MITCLNLLSGCLAVVFSFQYNEDFGIFKGYEIVYMLIAIAAVFDFMDGCAARLLNAYSEVGKELDSLADLISFGLAPALLVYNTMLSYSPDGFMHYVALLLAVFGALRLARFNVDERQASVFIGLPIPANALFWIGLCAWFHRQDFYFGDIMTSVLIVIFSLLMVAPLRMFSLKFKNLSFVPNIKRYALLFAGLLFIVSYQISGLAWTIVFYIMLSLLSKTTDEVEEL
ncbi:MAG: CDP-diacylglycerol--serine O-phosphatidyltransferase [Bacteroidales bacterium]